MISQNLWFVRNPGRNQECDLQSSLLQPVVEQYLIIQFVRMPAQHKYNKYQTKKHYSSSSSSSYRRKDKDHKSYHHQKWHKKQRSRSRSNPKETKYKFTSQSNKDERRHAQHPYQSKRADSYRRRDSEEDRRPRNDDKKNVTRYSFVREDRDKSYHQQYRKDERRQKNTEHKRRANSSSSSKSNSPKHNRQSSRRNDRSGNKFTYTKRDQNHFFNYDSRNERKQYEPAQNKQKIRQAQSQRVQQKEVQRQREKLVKSSQIPIFKQNQEKITNKPKVTMRMPFPPPPSSYNNKFQDLYHKKNQYQNRYQMKKEEPKREEKFSIKQQKRNQERQQKLQPKKQAVQKSYAQPIVQKIAPFKRQHQIKKQVKQELKVEQVQKKKISKFDMVLNEAKANLVLPLPPANFMTLDTFKNMNKFQIQTLDKRWANFLKEQSERMQDPRTLLSSIPNSAEDQTLKGRLWTYLKEQRNEAEHNLKIKFQQLKMINNNLNDMVRRLRLVQG